jgi:putative flippase GtrA
MLNNLINKLTKSDSSFAELFRTYIVGAFNLIFGLFLNYIFQFLILTMVSFPLRTYLTNTFSFAVGVVVSYFLSRKIIFQLSYRDGSWKEFIKYISVSLLNLGIPILVWFLINLWNPEFQKNELYYLLITVLIHGSILPIKYLIYKFFVFKDSL